MTIRRIPLEEDEADLFTKLETQLRELKKQTDKNADYYLKRFTEDDNNNHLIVSSPEEKCRNLNITHVSNDLVAKLECKHFPNFSTQSPQCSSLKSPSILSETLSESPQNSTLLLLNESLNNG